MADTVTLSAIVDPEEPPYQTIIYPALSGNALQVYPGKFLNVKSVWRLESCYIRYTASADVQNRYLVVRILNKDGDLLDGCMSPVIVANDVDTLIIGNMVQFQNSFEPYADYNVGLNGKGFLFYDPWYFNVVTITGHANDSIMVSARFKYMNEELGIKTRPETKYWYREY